MAAAVSTRALDPELVFAPHAAYAGLPVCGVHRTPLLTAGDCARIVELARFVGTARATQSRDPGLNTVLRLPVNGTGGSERVEAARLELLEYAFAVHGRACALARSLYGGDGVAVATPPKWKAMPRATVHDRLLANVTEWNRHAKFNMNVLQYTTRGGNVGTTLHRDESPLAFVVPLFRSRGVAGGGTEYAFLPATSRRVTVTPPAGTLVLHPGDVAHRGVPIAAHPDEEGERWILAGFLGTATSHPPLRPEPPLSRQGDVAALAARWGVEPMGCHVGRDAARTPRYRKQDGGVSPLHLGAKRRSVYTHTRSRRSGLAYKYYVTERCRKQGRLREVLGRLSRP